MNPTPNPTLDPASNEALSWLLNRIQHATTSFGVMNAEADWVRVPYSNPPPEAWFELHLGYPESEHADETTRLNRRLPCAVAGIARFYLDRKRNLIMDDFEMPRVEVDGTFLQMRLYDSGCTTPHTVLDPETWLNLPFRTWVEGEDAPEHLMLDAAKKLLPNVHISRALDELEKSVAHNMRHEAELVTPNIDGWLIWNELEDADYKLLRIGTWRGIGPIVALRSGETDNGEPELFFPSEESDSGRVHFQILKDRLLDLLVMPTLSRIEHYMAEQKLKQIQHPPIP